MRVTFRKNRNDESGGVLMVSLLAALIIGLVLTSYLLLTRAQHVSAVRSQAWHTALAAADAGVAEALAQINPAPFVAEVSSSSEWNLEGDFYTLNTARQLTPEVSYRVAYSKDSPPTIYSTGYVTLPTLSATLMRVVRVTTTNAPLFSTGAAVAGPIALNGADLFTDSFDSTSHYYSTYGRYDFNKHRNNGDIAIAGGLINPRRTEIRGKLFLSPTAPGYLGTGSSVNKGIFRDFNAEFPDMPAPSFSGIVYTPPPGTNGSETFTYFLRSYNYQTNFLSGSIYVAPGSKAVLYVTGDANITKLDLGPGASLKMYVGGANTTFGDMAFNGAAKDFQYFGLAGNTNLLLSDNFDVFTGTIYAPRAHFRAGDPRFRDVDIYGAIVTKSMSLRSDLDLHFDESLKDVTTTGLVRGFVVTSWTEL